MPDQKWEDVCSPQTDDYLERIKVPGGWIYRNTIYMRENEFASDIKYVSVAMTFVPDPKVLSKIHDPNN